MPRSYVGQSGTVHYDCTLEELQELICEARRVCFSKQRKLAKALAADLAEQEKTGQRTTESAAAFAKEINDELSVLVHSFTGGISREEAERFFGYSLFRFDWTTNDQQAL